MLEGNPSVESATMDQLNGAMPPDAARVTVPLVTSEPAAMFGRVVVVMVSGGTTVTSRLPGGEAV
jgi:hypothetical protein